MTIQLTPEQEQVVDRAIQAGLIRSADDVVGVGVEAIQRRLEGQRASVDSTSAEEWLKEFHTWVHSHPTTTPPLSDEAVNRDSIYGTRGR
jgi:Arc/MetJ-type ribon-helix-helix transcriptional regulator